MSNQELAEILFEMSMDMDWMDYEDSRESTVNQLESDLEEIGEALRGALERIAMPYCA